MKRFLTIIISICIGVVIGTTFVTAQTAKETAKPCNVTVHVGDFLNKTQAVSYSSDKLPVIRVDQATAIRKFRSLYSSAMIKSISLTLDKDAYVYNIVGFDDRKDCMIQIDATNNKIIGQSTQVLNYDFDKETYLNLDKTISRKKATAIATKEFSNGTPISWELEDINEQAIWKIILIRDEQKREIKINAETGAVM